MDMPNNFNITDEQKNIPDVKATNMSERFTQPERVGVNLNAASDVYSPLSAQYQGRTGNELLNLLAHQEPSHADTAPSGIDVDLLNFRMGGADSLYDDSEHASRNFFMGHSRPESVASASAPMWSDNAGLPSSRNGELLDTFDFFVKSLSSANNYLSMLTRDQVAVLRAVRPSLLYELLQEVAKVRSDKRMRRALPNECAFCKNNGENEECYSSHLLKDWRGRVLCPVLRAFRCPRCGATGDRAHTIKYCPENVDTGSERSGLARRRGASSLVLGGAMSGPSRTQPPTPTPAPSPSPATPQHQLQSSLWSTFGIN